MKPSVVSLLLALGVLSGCDGSGMDFPVIGYDKNGQLEQVMVPEKEFSARLQTLVTTSNDSVLPVLSKSDKDDGGWMIRTFAMGVGINASVGIGAWTVGAVPKSRMIFTNSSSPTLP